MPRGGKRPGAGRPPAGTVRLHAGPMLPADLYADFEALREAEGLSTPEAVREAVELWVARGMEIATGGD